MNPENNNLNEKRLIACDHLIQMIEAFNDGQNVNLIYARDRAQFAYAYFNHGHIEKGRKFYAAANAYIQAYLMSEVA